MKYLILLIPSLAIVGCSFTGPSERICTREFRPGIVVSVSVPSPGESDDGSLVVAREGEYADSAVTREGTAALAYERAGVYTITVEKEGYDLWQRKHIPVVNGECHVETVELKAVLVE